MADSTRQFFEELEGRVDPTRAAGLTNTYLFDIKGAGQWTVDVDDGKVTVTEGAGPADTTIMATDENFMRLVRREQTPTAAYMRGRLKIKGDMGAALKLQKLL